MRKGDRFQFGPGGPGLFPAELRQGYIGLAGKPVFEVPGGLSMPDENEQRHTCYFVAKDNYSLPVLPVSRATGQLARPSGQQGTSDLVRTDAPVNASVQDVGAPDGSAMVAGRTTSSSAGNSGTATRAQSF